MSAAPNVRGRFGAYGGRYVPETLMAALDELEAALPRIVPSEPFQRELGELLSEYAGRPTPLYRARRLSEEFGASIYLKREDLAHTGAHKINNVLGQVLLAKYMGKQRVIAETGAGQHGVATATACALLGIACEVFMGEEDVARQALNVFKMELLGAQVHAVTCGSRTLKDAINEAMRDWVTNVRTTYYCIGSVMGPHPYPTLVRDFQRVIGVEPAGEGLHNSRHGATLTTGVPGIFHGQRTLVLSDDDGQICPAHSVSAGLDYPGVGPEHAFLRDSGRVSYVSVTDAEAVDAFQYLSRSEGIIPALESAHAIAHVRKLGPSLGRDTLVIVNLSGRGDKDAPQVRELLRQAEPSEVSR